MASNNYYGNTPSYDFNESLRPGNFQSPSNTTSRTDLDSIYNKYSATSPRRSLTPTPSYESTDRTPYKQLQNGYADSETGSIQMTDQYADNIPLKPAKQTPLRTDWRAENTAYPPSPESQQDQAIGFVPQTTSMTKKGWFSGKIAWVVYVVSTVQIAVFISEIVKNAIITGSPIMIHPQFNPMIGPSTYVLINTGARFVPCMRTIPEVENSTVPISWPCPNTTSSDPTNPSNHCDLATLCGFSAIKSAASFDQHPDQWFRFIVPMFLHAGIVHIGFNMLLQLTMGREMELAIGSVRFALVYFSSGIFGFVLGGNFAATAIASTGASGCLFGILALTLLDLIYCWKERPSPVKDLMWILADVLVSFVLGLLPGLDNFSHIGGFLMGLALGICILHSPNPLRERIGLTPVPYSPMPTNPKRPTTAVADPLHNFAKQPVGFFKGRKPLWWVWWLLRAGALIGVLIGFVVLLNNFYKYRDTCSWCKYLSCLPINNWCNIGNLQLSNTTTNNKLRRDLMFGADELGAGLAKGLWEIGPMLDRWRTGRVVS